MGGEDDIGAAIASAVLIGVAAQGYRKAPFYYVRPGMHANFVIHGVLGLINYQSGVFKLDVAQPFKFSTAAAKYLAIPCLMADMTTDRNISALHVISGAIPFVLELANQPNPQLGNIVIVVNIIALCYHAFKAERRWEWYCAGASILAYFVAPTTGAAKSFCKRVMGGEDDVGAATAHVVLLGVPAHGFSKAPGYSTNDCTRPGVHANFAFHGVIGVLHYQSATLKLDVSQAYKISKSDLTTDNLISTLHFIFGVVLFVMELAGKPNPQLGNTVIAVIIVALCYYALQREKPWG